MAHERRLFFMLCGGLQRSSLPPAAEQLAALGPVSDARSYQADVDEACLERILKRNAHARDALSIHGSPDGKGDYVGVWPLLSMLNHSCMPNVERFFVGDVVLLRANRPLCQGAELLDVYTSNFRPRHVRQAALQTHYGFSCDCFRCQFENEVLPDCVSKPLMERLEQLASVIKPGRLEESANAFEALEEDAATACAKALEAANQPKTKLPNHDALAVLKASFLPVSMAVAFAWQRLGQAERSSAAHGRCCSAFEAVAPTGSYHAHWAAAWAAQAFCALQARPGHTDLAKTALHAAQHARAVHAAAYGATFWLRQVKLLEWCAELVHLSLPPDLEDISLELASDLSGYRLCMKLSRGVAVSDVRLDISSSEVIIEALERSTSVALPKFVEPALAPAARYKSKTHSIVLSLPFPGLSTFCSHVE